VTHRGCAQFRMAAIAFAGLVAGSAVAQPEHNATNGDDGITQSELDELGEPDSPETAPHPKRFEGDWDEREIETLEEGYAWGPHSTWPTRPHVIPSDSSNSDGAYGRFAGRLEAGVGLGTEFNTQTPLLAARFTLHYFSTAGVYVMYATSFNDSPPAPTSASRLGPPRATTDTPNRLSAGVDLRPLFLPRFAQDYEQGPAFLDLTIDSMSLAVGVFWQQAPDGNFGDVRGLEASIGGGIPLFAKASGLWIRFRGFGRWQTDVVVPASPEWTGLALLTYQQVLPL
jgi:hypothetical protein